MKILKIEEHKGYFRVGEKEEWQQIDAIDKNALLQLLDLFLENEVSMDSPDDYDIGNQAHSIIYQNIFRKLSALTDEKARFKDESQRLYLDEIKKYSEVKAT